MDDKVMCICGNIFEPNKIWNEFFEKGIVLKCPLCNNSEDEFLNGRIVYHIKSQSLWDAFVNKYEKLIIWMSGSALTDNNYNSFMREGSSDCVFIDRITDNKLFLVRSPMNSWKREKYMVVDFEG